MLKFVIKQSKISVKFTEHYLTKAKVPGLTDDRRPDFLKNVII